MKGRRTEKVLVQHHGDGAPRRRPDEVIVEEPLEIRLDGNVVATTMRTPGHDFELAVGFLHAEGLLDGAKIRQVMYCGSEPAHHTDFNVVTVETDGNGPAPLPRLGPVNSACGICGSDQLTSLSERLQPIAGGARLPAGAVPTIVRAVTEEMELFARTGAVHGATLLDSDLKLLVTREDIGRHNAVDKIVGRLRLDGRLPGTDLALVISSRASYEMVQKAWAAGIGTLIAVSAPSELAIATATRAEMTLVGFVRGESFNVYSGELGATDS